jgi:sigma-B regulation protein RsbU (phosphoserine phosphatase)
VPGLDVGAVFEPFAGAIGLAGDFYDLFPLGPDRWMLAIGDVVGKGADAAAATGLVRHTLWGAAQHAPTPAAVAHAINAALLRQGAERFATLVLALLTPATDGLGVDAVWAGHPPGLLLRDGIVDLVHGSGFPVGMFADVEFSPVRFTVRPGETLMLYTDGLLERRGTLLDEQALTERLLAHARRPAQDLLRAVIGAISDRYPARDDVAALALRPV